jgi:tRNA pseudouridine55 synthase
VQLEPREVTISGFEPTRFSRPAADLLDVDVEVECSSGTYVRALARDLGARLGVGGHLTALRRTRVGPFTLADACPLEDLETRSDPVTLPLAAAIRAAFPVRTVTPEEAGELSFGRALARAGIAGTHGALTAAGEAIALLREDERAARPVLVFRPAASQ